MIATTYGFFQSSGAARCHAEPDLPMRYRGVAYSLDHLPPHARNMQALLTYRGVRYVRGARPSRATPVPGQMMYRGVPH